MKSKKPNLSILDISLTSGGAEKVISLLLKELINDYNVTLVLFYNEIHFPIPKEVDTVIFCDKKPNRPFYLKILDFTSFIFRYSKLLKKKEISYAVSFLAFPNFVNGIAALFNKKTKTFISERGFPSDNTTSKLSLYISKLFYPLLYNRCFKLFSNSVHINKDLKDNFNVKIQMDVVYNPIETPKKTIVPNSLAYDFKIFKIINVGSLNIRKNQFMIIKALQELGNEFHLTILGKGPDKKALFNQIKSGGLHNEVSLEGNVKNVNDYLSKSHCFILSSNTEGFPNALLEAMAVGLPCISTNCLSGPLEMLNNNEKVIIEKEGFVKAQYGILINNDDHVGLSKALKYLSSNPLERKKYSELSLIRAQEYHLSNIYKQFYQFLNN